MSISDPIADMFTSIRNALAVSYDSLTVQYSTIKCDILKILTKEGYINGYEIINQDLNKKRLLIKLKYDNDGIPIIESIKRISKSSKRVYLNKKSIYKVLNGFGTLILSTSKGLLTGKDARLKNVGGEVLGEIY